jgi:hypothetical protein
MRRYKLQILFYPVQLSNLTRVDKRVELPMVRVGQSPNQHLLSLFLSFFFIIELAF